MTTIINFLATWWALFRKPVIEDAMILQRLLLCLRLAIPHRASRCSMSLSSSSGHKVLQSPFSHTDLYGVQYPLCNGSKASSLPSSAPVKRKPKPPKCIKSTKSAGHSESRSMKPKRKRKGAKISSAPTLLPARNQTHKVSPPSTLSVAQVDSGSPSGSRKPPRPNGMHYRPNGTHTTSPNGSLVNYHKAIPRNAHRNRRTPATHTLKGEANPSVDCVAFSTVSDDRDTQRIAPLSSPISNLLTFSNMSTSEVVLRMGGSSRQASSALAGHVSKPIPSLHLPPHMKVHRQAFQTGSRQLGTFGRRKGAWPLDVEEISRGLGRLQYRHIIVMSGAGVSTPSGIPDFR